MYSNNGYSTKNLDKCSKPHDSVYTVFIGIYKNLALSKSQYL